jgi:ATP synthase protein I
MSGKQGGDGGSFEDRLRAARNRQGLDAPPPGRGPADQGTTNALAIGLRVGVELLAAMIVAVAIGWALDRWLHTSPFLLALFVLLGGAAGIMNVWRLLAPRSSPGK